MTDKDCMTKEQPHEQHLLDLPCFDHDTSPPEQGHTVKEGQIARHFHQIQKSNNILKLWNTCKRGKRTTTVDSVDQCPTPKPFSITRM